MTIVKTIMVVEDPQDPDNLLLDLGLELCEKLGWKVGDTIDWIDNKDGSWTLTKLPRLPQTT